MKQILGVSLEGFLFIMPVKMDILMLCNTLWICITVIHFVKMKTKFTPLHLASQNGHLDVVRYFTTVHHCNPLVKNSYNATPLHLAALKGKLDVVKFFIEDLNCEADIRGHGWKDSSSFCQSKWTS